MSVLHVLPVSEPERAKIQFTKVRTTTRAPFVIYADFELILEPLGEHVQRTTFAQHHKVCAAPAILCSNMPDFNQRPIMKFGPKARSDFLGELIKWEREIIAVLIRNKKMKSLNMRQQAEFDNATRCYLCRDEFTKHELKGPKVRDHDNITGDFLGAAHLQCNLQRAVSFQIPVFFHNFRGYDAHFIVYEFGKLLDREIKTIGQNIKKYFQVQ